MGARIPEVDFLQEPQWRWPAWKFGLRCEDLFGELHHRHNTYEAPLQDFEAFHHDVWEISTSASSADEFHRGLSERKQQRLKEMSQSFDDMAAFLTAGSSMLSEDAWGLGVQYFRTRSLDSLLRFLFSFLNDVDKDSMQAMALESADRNHTNEKAVQAPDTEPSAHIDAATLTTQSSDSILPPSSVTPSSSDAEQPLMGMPPDSSLSSKTSHDAVSGAVSSSKPMRSKLSRAHSHNRIRKSPSSKPTLLQRAKPGTEKKEWIQTRYELRSCT
ncbi:hypothetical protein F4810DRAFT_151775 [Camillea tinctor]|nr:hypothetical protein F4810DRAFT_151775 [Camillea tinctor]